MTRVGARGHACVDPRSLRGSPTGTASVDGAQGVGRAGVPGPRWRACSWPLAGCGGGSAPAPTPPTPTATARGTGAGLDRVGVRRVVPMVARLTAAPAVRTRRARGDPAGVPDLPRTTACDDRPCSRRARRGRPRARSRRGRDRRAGPRRRRRPAGRPRRRPDQVERADPSSAVSLGRALVGGGKLVGALLNGAQVGGTINRDPVLHDAYDRAPSCAQLQRSGATATPTPGSPPTR